LFFLVVFSLHRAIIKNVKKLNLIINASAYNSVKFLDDTSSKTSKSVFHQDSDDKEEENDDILSRASSSRSSAPSIGGSTPPSPLDVDKWCANNINQAREVDKYKRINKYIKRAISNIQDDEDLLSVVNWEILLGSNTSTTSSEDDTTTN
jgi:hypothetical protein